MGPQLGKDRAVQIQACPRLTETPSHRLLPSHPVSPQKQHLSAVTWAQGWAGSCPWAGEPTAGNVGVGSGTGRGPAGNGFEGLWPCDCAVGTALTLRGGCHSLVEVIAIKFPVKKGCPSSQGQERSSLHLPKASTQPATAGPWHPRQGPTQEHTPNSQGY